MENKLLKKIKWNLFLMGKFKIPLLGYTGVKLDYISDSEARVSIKLKRRTKNHLNSMYFGAMAVGADVAGGIHAFYYALNMNKKISFAFKSMNAQFLKRAESDCVFISKDGEKVKNAVLQSISNNERINQKIKVVAFNSLHEPVAEFEMEISVKCLN